MWCIKGTGYVLVSYCDGPGDNYDDYGEYYEDVEITIAYFSSKKKAEDYIKNSKLKSGRWKAGSLLRGYTDCKIEKVDTFNPTI